MLFIYSLLFWVVELWASPGLDAVSQGDLARYQKDHLAAQALYRKAVESGEPAAEAMARLRLLVYTGNFGAWVHGPKIDKALANAEGIDGELAWTDFHLFAPGFVGARREEAVRLAQGLLEDYPAEATSRLYLATGDKLFLRALAELPSRDGLGEGLLQSGGMLPPNPGTWNLGLGFSGAPGLGIGAGLSFRHPNWRGWTVESWLGGSTVGLGYALLRTRTPGRFFVEFDGGISRTRLYLYEQDERTSLWRQAKWLEFGPGFQRGFFRTWIHGVVREDDIGGGAVAGTGVQAGLALDRREGWGASRRGGFFSFQWESVLGEQMSHHGIFADLRVFAGLLGGVWAARVTHHQALQPDVPVFWLPTVGGMTMHRGAPYQRWRAEWISTLDIEERWMLWGPIEGVVFGNIAWVAREGVHPAGGVGIRLLMPPEESNVSRFDLAFSDTGWGLYGTWGEAF